MRHIGIFSNSGDVQTAIDAGTLVNPYVALVSGAVDINTVQPYVPCFKGEWTGGQGTYTFKILDTEPSSW